MQPSFLVPYASQDYTTHAMAAANMALAVALSNQGALLPPWLSHPSLLADAAAGAQKQASASSCQSNAVASIQSHQPIKTTLDAYLVNSMHHACICTSLSTKPTWLASMQNPYGWHACKTYMTGMP